jgi:hypothetical protein
MCRLALQPEERVPVRISSPVTVIAAAVKQITTHDLAHHQANHHQYENTKIRRPSRPGRLPCRFSTSISPSESLLASQQTVILPLIITLMV